MGNACKMKFKYTLPTIKNCSESDKNTDYYNNFIKEYSNWVWFERSYKKDGVFVKIPQQTETDLNLPSTKLFGTDIEIVNLNNLDEMIELLGDSRKGDLGEICPRYPTAINYGNSTQCIRKIKPNVTRLNRCRCIILRRTKYGGWGGCKYDTIDNVFANIGGLNIFFEQRSEGYDITEPSTWIVGIHKMKTTGEKFIYKLVLITTRNRKVEVGDFKYEGLTPDLICKGEELISLSRNHIDAFLVDNPKWALKCCLAKNLCATPSFQSTICSDSLFNDDNPKCKNFFKDDKTDCNNDKNKNSPKCQYEYCKRTNRNIKCDASDCIRSGLGSGLGSGEDNHKSYWYLYLIIPVVFIFMIIFLLYRRK